MFLIAVALNLALLQLPFDLKSLGGYGYLGVGVLVFLNNATVLLPVSLAPGVVAKAAAELSLGAVILSSAAGSVLGESIGFWVGRAGKGVIERSRIYEWFQRQLQHPVRAVLAIFILAAVPNPSFDVVGLAAGAIGLRYPLFFIPAFLGNVIKMLIFALLGTSIMS